MMVAVVSTMPMIEYQVIDISGDGTLMSLQDDGGRLHVARIGDGTAPLREDCLLGRQAKLGPHLLLVGERRTPIRVHFEAVACTQDQALALMHPTANAVDLPLTPPPPDDGSEWPEAGGRRR